MASSPADARSETENEAIIDASDDLFPARPQFESLQYILLYDNAQATLAAMIGTLTRLRSMITSTALPSPPQIANVNSAFDTLQTNLTHGSNNVTVSATHTGGFGGVGHAEAGHRQGYAGRNVVASVGSLLGAAAAQAAPHVSTTDADQHRVQ